MTASRQRPWITPWIIATLLVCCSSLSVAGFAPCERRHTAVRSAHRRASRRSTGLSSRTTNTAFNNAWSKLVWPFANGQATQLAQRQQLKEALLRECRVTSSSTGLVRATVAEDDALAGGVSQRPNRARMDAAIAALAAVSPSPSPSLLQSRLQHTWRLIWTTEREINFFVDQGWTSSSDCITQTIEGRTLTNTIPLSQIRSTNQQGSGSTGMGSLTVVGQLSRVETDPVVRTRFAFTTAILDVGRWGRYTLPPVGQGWLDTVYLDDTFRVDVNSRNDILICQKADKSKVWNASVISVTPLQ